MSQSSSVNSKAENCSLITLPKIFSASGSLTSVNEHVDIPFEIKRVYYLYDIPSGETRGGHAHKNLYQLLVAASGSFSVELFDGIKSARFNLNRPNTGLLIVPGIWREIENFSSGSICLVLASEVYDESDYIRDYKAFISYKSSYGV